jgi:hypothetical protein
MTPPHLGMTSTVSHGLTFTVTGVFISGHIRATEPNFGTTVRPQP